MKKIALLFCLAVSSFALVKCGYSKKAAAASVPVKYSFSNEIQTAVAAHCSPCHIPSKGGKKTAYDVYDNMKSDIDDIIRRIELNPDQKGFMPFRKEKLDSATIAVFKKWKEDGMEK